MNNHGNNRLYFSIGTGVFIILSIILLFVSTPAARPALMTLSSLVILLAVGSILIVFNQVKRIENRISKLPQDYQKAYLNINESLGTYGISKRNIQSIMAMILEIFEHAALEKRTLDSVIGSDLKTFTEGFISEFTKPFNLKYLLNYSTMLFLMFILLIKAYKVIRTGDLTLTSIRSETLDVGIVITYFIISFTFAPWLLLNVRKATQDQWEGLKRLRLLLPLFIPTGLFMGLIMINEPKWRAFIDAPLPLLTTPLHLIIALVLLAITLFFSWYQKQ